MCHRLIAVIVVQNWMKTEKLKTEDRLPVRLTRIRMYFIVRFSRRADVWRIESVQFVSISELFRKTWRMVFYSALDVMSGS